MLSPTNSTWTEEELLISGDDFFSSVIIGMNDAKQSIDFETYIFTNDKIGRRVADALISAVKRGVKVRVIVDGAGSYGWMSSLGTELVGEGVEVKIYHQLPWERLFSTSSKFNNYQLIITLFRFINRRNHRKVCIVDEETVWNGSMNVCDVTLPQDNGEPAWREMGIRVKGEGVPFFTTAFNLVWYRRSLKNRISRKIAKDIIKKSEFSLVRVNSTMQLRSKMYKNLLKKLNEAKKRIWIGNAYFVPSRSFVKDLQEAVRRGVDVRLLVTIRSDIFFMPWVSAAFQSLLLHQGVKLFGYKPSIFHAKYMIIDDEAMIGSSNINQRSLLHDLEADVVTTNPTTVNSVITEFTKDFAVSESITIEDFLKMPWWKKLLGKVVLLLKYFL